MDAWLAHPAVRPFIRVNAWEGVEWFHRESWDELIAWTDRLEWMRGSATGDAPPLEPTDLARVLEAAGAVAGYRVDLLREALGAEPEPGASEPEPGGVRARARGVRARARSVRARARGVRARAAKSAKTAKPKDKDAKKAKGKKGKRPKKA